MELINTLEAPGEFDALTTLRPGEPYFLLVGRDKLAPKLVQEWADQNRRRAMAEADSGAITQAKLEEEQRKSTQAEKIGWAMQAYKRGDEAKAQVVTERVTYSGHDLPEATRKTDKLQSIRAVTAQAINTAAAELNGLLIFARENDFMAAEQDLFEGTVKRLQELSDIVQPPRMGLRK